MCVKEARLLEHTELLVKEVSATRIHKIVVMIVDLMIGLLGWLVGWLGGVLGFDPLGLMRDDKTRGIMAERYSVAKWKFVDWLGDRRLNRIDQ